MNTKTRNMLLIIAGAMLVFAIAWYCIKGTGDELSKLALRVNEFGYSFVGDDVFIAYDDDDTTIAELLADKDVDLDAAVDASKQCGFSSDVNKRGGVTLALLNDKEHDSVVTLYIVDGEMELCFLEDKDGNPKPLS